ncbi:hypothetical protein PF005_g20578 [Phytophthora fragariae]|uniref:Uncharacterized protein n=2 Tax=Phytophthora fragariae TaxID=53985 RepID=A0A6A3WLF6_9STRA|nr:hypothetical protein PF011_g17319 [Phytophthora fragariae]KAE9187117.1 hypothetical protein PF005_g20578 [Phytophthora fragariae]
MESHPSDNLGVVAPGDGGSEKYNLGRLRGAASSGDGSKSDNIGGDGSESDNLGRLHGAASGGDGSESDNIGRLRGAASGSDGSESDDIGRLRGAAPGGDISESDNLGRLRGAASGGDGSESDNIGRLRGAASGSGGSESDDIGRLRGAASGSGGSESDDIGRLRGAASGGDISESDNLGRLRGAASGSVGSENDNLGCLRGAASGGGGSESDNLGLLRGAASGGGPALAPKRKRGRPKGSKNKAKTTTDSEPARKCARPAKLKASPKRSLVHALGQVQDNAAPATQSSLASTESASLPGETSVTSAPVTDTADSEASVPSARTGTIQQTGSPATPSAGTRRNSPARPPPIPGLYVDTLVAFSPEKEGWTKRKKTKDKYAGVGSAYLVGRVCRIIKGAMFQVQWLDSQYQRKDEHLNLSMIQRGNANYRSLHGSTSRVGWSHLCAVEEGEQIEVEGNIDDMEECEELFDPPMELPTTLAEVEAIKNMRFDPVDKASTIILLPVR